MISHRRLQCTLEVFIQLSNYSLSQMSVSEIRVLCRFDSIVDYIESLHSVDLLVMSTRAIKGTLKRALMGSVSSYCLYHANCPVLVVPPPSTSMSAKGMSTGVLDEMQVLCPTSAGVSG